MKLLKKIISVIAISFLLMANASEIPTNGSFMPSLDWQKMSLEKAISGKVKNSLSKIVKSNEYLVDVEINVNPPTKPRFTPPDNNPGGAGGEGEKKGQIKIKDVKPDDLPKDYIVFSKLGLEAPLIDDFDNFKDGKNGEKKDDKKQETLPPFEQLWKYNKSLDIFNNLESVKIYVQLSEKLHPTTRDNIKKVLNALKFNLNEITPELEITYINMDEKKSGVELPSSLKELLALLARFSNMIGLVLAAIMLGLIAFMLFNKWEKMEKDKQAADAAAAQAAKAPEEEEEEDDDIATGAPGGPFDQDNTSSSVGIERFQTFLDHSPIEAVVMVKNWINSGESKEKNALRALVQQLDNDTLGKLFKKLSSEEKETWKSFLDKQVQGADLIDTNAFISNAIVQNILVPYAIVDADVADLLMRITPEKAAEFVQENPDLGKILMNVMNAKFISRILENLDSEYVELALARGMEYKKEEVAGVLEDFKAKLSRYKESKTKIPFIEKIMELIPISMPSRENALFKALAQNVEEVKLVKEVALKYFPAVLVPALPERVLKVALQTYPMDRKVELISSVTEDLREKFVNIFAPTGSKASDVLQLEMEKIESDLGVQRKIKDNPDQIWKEFVDFSRKVISNDKVNALEFENMVGQWVERVMAGESPESAVSGIDPDKTASSGELKIAA